LAAGSGCGGANPFGVRAQEGPLLEPVKVSELRPGCYCEIDMVVPPIAPNDSFDCFKGTVKEINHDEVVLTNAVEESCIDYGASSHRRQPTQQKRDMVRVPLTGIDTIWALPPAKDNVAMKPSTAKLPLPSSGAQPMPPPRAAASAKAEEPASPAGTSRSSSPPLPETPAHFDLPPAASGAAQ
jgi:hypothetical protein